MDETNIDNQSLIQKKIAFAQGGDIQAVIEILKDVRTKHSSIIADDEFKTLVNALTLEIESQIITRFIIELEQIKQGKLLNEKE